ncbi:MAG: DUF481 domain-containing protein [Campylobacterota bacterium]|nr:DUF481 domain-containing protein [Campylobacterota bacterium]
MKKIVLGSLVATSILFADDAAVNSDDEFKLHAELGYIQTTGNTKTSSFSTDLSVKKGWGKHRLKYDFNAQFASENDKQTKNNMFNELNYYYSINKIFEFNYLVGYKQDKFSGFDYQAYTGPGGLYKVINSDIQKLNLSGNVLYEQDNIVNTATQTNYIKNYGAYVVKGYYKWDITKSFAFIQDASYRAEFKESSNFFVFSKSAVVSKITEMFSFGVSYKVDYKNQPPEGKEKTDTTFTASIIIDY